MHRAVLLTCWPWFICLVVAGMLAVLLVQFCGGRCQWRRWRDLHADQGGAVQSLSLVLTLPVFLLLLLFIVQISQMMIGVMMVHYAAFAAARAASVWIPADVTTDPTLYDDLTEIDLVHDQLQGGPERANVIQGRVQRDLSRVNVLQLESGANTIAVSVKYQKVVLAALIPCMAISPSRDFSWANQLPASLVPTYNALTKIFPDMNPRSRSNVRMPKRLMNKLIYSQRFTNVVIEWQEISHPATDVDSAPTYNPRNHPATLTGQVPMWNENEVGFRDPVTVRVTHQFGLLPGIGRILKMGMVNGAGGWQSQNQNDAVSKQITQRTQTQQEELYTLGITAEATFVNEGYKSMLRYAIQP